MSGTATVFLFVCFAVVAAQELYEDDVCKTVKNIQWTCKRIKDCKKAIQLRKSGGDPEVCGFSGNDPVVCCEPDSGSQGSAKPVLNIARPLPTNPVQTGAKASQMCQEYGRLVFVTISDVSGNDFQYDTCETIAALITGGTKSEPREFPHMAQIGYGQQLRFVRWRCGGSLISKNFVLSAAHCNDDSEVKAGWVRLGEYNVKTTTDEENGDARPVVHQIIEIINHPNYKAPVTEYDITLYRLATDVVFNEYVRPICLHTESYIPNSYAVACGWGDTEFTGRSSDVLQKVNLSLTSAGACRGLYPANENLPSGIRTEAMFCAGGTDKKDTCQGDSGGPLQVAHPTVYCMYSLIGITSFGRACAIQPGVYTRVSYYIPWIESIVWQ